MKRKAIRILIIVIAAILLIPFPVAYKDGGSHGWDAIFWRVTFFHQMMDVDGTTRVGTQITIFGDHVIIYDNTQIVPYDGTP